MSTPTGIKVSALKTWVAAAGTVVTAVAGGIAAVQLAVKDGSLGVDEVGSVSATLVSIALTIWGVYRAPRYTSDRSYVGDAEGGYDHL